MISSHFWDICSVDWWFISNVSGQPTDQIFNGQAVYNACLTLKEQRNGQS
jgi:hypothetical protein